jgi:hypothetical protein
MAHWIEGERHKKTIVMMYSWQNDMPIISWKTFREMTLTVVRLIFSVLVVLVLLFW